MRLTAVTILNISANESQKGKNTIPVMYKEMIFETDVRTNMKADAA